MNSDYYKFAQIKLFVQESDINDFDLLDISS